MSGETSTQSKYVYTGSGSIRTEDGLRSNIDAGKDDSRPFVASVGWLKRHHPVRHLLKSLKAYEADKAKAKRAQPTPAKAEEKPAKAAKRTPRRVTKPKE